MNPEHPDSSSGEPVSASPTLNIQAGPPSFSWMVGMKSVSRLVHQALYPSHHPSPNRNVYVPQSQRQALHLTPKPKSPLHGSSVRWEVIQSDSKALVNLTRSLLKNPREIPCILSTIVDKRKRCQQPINREPYQTDCQCPNQCWRFSSPEVSEIDAFMTSSVCCSIRTVHKD